MNKLLPFLVVSLFFLSLVPIGSCDVIVYTGQYFYVGNETYGVTHTMKFSYIQHNSAWIKFNTTDFNITSANNIYINLTFLHENFSNAKEGEKVLEFYATTTGGAVNFSISGFPADDKYTIRKDGNYLAFSQGNVSFVNSIWSTAHIIIYKYSPKDAGGGPAIGLETDTNCYQRVWTKDDVGQIVLVYSGGRIKRITGYESIIVVGIDDVSKFEDFLGFGYLQNNTGFQ